MRFMIIRKADPDTEAGVEPTEELAAAMMQYHEEMGRELKILGGDGLRPSRDGARVSFKAGKPLVTDGPFAETKELIAGYTLVEADSLEQVLAWAKRWPAHCDGGDQLQLEVRRLYEIEDFGDAFTPELKAQHERVLGKR